MTFANNVQSTFQAAVKDEINENIISKDEIFSSLKHKNARTFYIYQNDIKNQWSLHFNQQNTN